MALDRAVEIAKPVPIRRPQQLRKRRKCRSRVATRELWLPGDPK